MGGCRCSYKNCQNTTKTTENIHFFHYPVKQKERCMKWIENANKPKFFELEEEQLKNKVVCELHFEDRWFPNNQRKRLLQGAIPTLDAGSEKFTRTDPPVYMASSNLNDLQVLPANDEGTVFILDTDNVFVQSKKMESYVYKNGVLVPSQSLSDLPKPKLVHKYGNNTLRPSTSKRPFSEIELEVVKSSGKPEGVAQEEFAEVKIKKEIDEQSLRDQSQDFHTYEMPSASQSEGFEVTMKTEPGIRHTPTNTDTPKQNSDKSVNKQYLRKIKQHSREIASIKRLLKQTLENEKPPDIKSVLNVLQNQIPPTLFSIISMILGEKNELNEEDVEFFTTIHRTSPEVYQLLSDKYKWNLPSVDVVDMPE